MEHKTYVNYSHVTWNSKPTVGKFPTINAFNCSRWHLNTKCVSNRVRRGQKVSPYLWFLCIHSVDENNRVKRDQSKNVKDEQWCGWINMEKSMNSFAGLFCIWSKCYKRPSLNGKKRCTLPKQKSSLKHHYSYIILYTILSYWKTIRYWAWIDPCSASMIPEKMQNMLLLWLAVTTNKMHYAVKKSYDFMSMPFPWKGFVLSHGKEYLKHLLNLTSCFFRDSTTYKHQKI